LGVIAPEARADQVLAIDKGGEAEVLHLRCNGKRAAIERKRDAEHWTVK
jgi:hypothetical protein